VKTLVTEVAGVVSAPAAPVRDALARALLPGRRPDLRGRFSHEDAPGHTSTVEATDTMIAIQGGWWYRGEWTVEPHPSGTLVVHRVYNVAQWMRWGVGLANRFFIGFPARTRAAFSAILEKLSKELGVPAEVTTPP
jgi:hypothetical protein